MAAHLRNARTHRHAGQTDDHRHDERSALLPAAPAGALDQFAVLDGEKYGIEVVSHDGVWAVPGDRWAGAIRIVERVRKFRESSHEAELYRQREKDLVGRPPAPLVRHVGIPNVRCFDESRRGGGHRRADTGNHWETAPPQPAQYELAAVQARAHRRKQMARGAIWN